MPLNVGSRLGHYDVTALIGEGGMGQVYQATDTKLKRQVALKILPDAFSADPERLARFQREAEVLASLNHPNIAAIYGLEEAEGIRALVLELVEGPTLADRIKQGPIPLDEALPIAKQMAEALEAAHEQGVIHRDLKPANVKVKDDGTVKVLDFGLAKALDPSPGGDPSQSPTLTAAATQMGVIMGTASFMSPEQARGSVADHRADIWSFGVVFFEMLSGKRLFEGATVSDTLAAVLRADLDWKELPADTPGAVRRLLRRCLARDRRERLQHIGDARVEIKDALALPSQDVEGPGPVAQPAGWRQALPWALGALLVGNGVTGIAVWNLTRPVVEPLTRLTVTVPEGLQPFNVRVSPDGRMIAFEGRGGGQSQVYLRSLDQLEAVPVRGAAGWPQGFSPDGESLLYDESGQSNLLRRVSLAGGPATTVAQARIGGADWGPENMIVQGAVEGLWLVPATGGNPTQLTTTANDEGEIGHGRPRFLPNGRAVLFSINTGDPDTAQVAVYDMAAGTQRTLMPGTSPEFITSGHLVFWRDNALWAVAFDPDALEIQGDPVAMIEGIQAGNLWLASYAVSPDGTLVYVPGDASVQRSLVWVDRDGAEESLPMPPREFESPTLSPDGKQVVVSIGGSLEGGNLYRWDVERQVEEQVTFSGADIFPKWSPDGSQIAFSSRRNGTPDVYVMAADGSGTPRRLTENPLINAVNDWLPDGETLIVGQFGGPTRGDITTLRIGSGETPEMLLQTDASEYTGVISPNGRWLAYRADDGGLPQVYVRPFPDVNSDLPRLIGVGHEPLWGPDGRKLFYRVRGVGIMVVDVETGDTFERGTPRQLFPDTYHFGGSQNWDLAPDGRFLMITQRATSASPELVIVQNWGEELTRLVPVGQ